MKNNLRAGERVLLEEHPHVLGKLGAMLFWLLVSLTPLTILYTVEPPALPGNPPVIGSISGDWLLLALSSLAIITATLLYTIRKISVKPLLAGLTYALLIPGLAYKTGLEPVHAAYASLLLGAMILAGIELSRRRYKYVVTDQRVIITHDGLWKKSSRELSYSRISDIVVEKGGLGRILDYGNVNIITSSGLGTGQDYAMAGGGVGASIGPVTGGVAAGGGKSVSTPRSREPYMLYMIPSPEKVAGIISERVRASESAPILERIARRLEERED